MKKPKIFLIWLPILIIDVAELFYYVSYSRYMSGVEKDISAKLGFEFPIEGPFKKAIANGFGANKDSGVLTKLCAHPLIVIAVTTIIGILLTMLINSKYHLAMDLYETERKVQLQAIASGKSVQECYEDNNNAELSYNEVQQNNAITEIVDTNDSPQMEGQMKLF